MVAIDIIGLSHTYPDGHKALKSINLQIASHKKTVILGANGSGKSTLIYHLNGIFLPQEGKIQVLNDAITKENRFKIREKVGLLFDNPDHQLFSNTVFNDIAFGPRNLKLPEDIVRTRVIQAMKMVDIENLQEKPPYNLSWGQKKRVAIAGLLAMKPDMLVCDEPFSGLDPSASGRVLSILDDLSTKGSTLIVSTHDVNIAYAWADEIIIMREGEILEKGGVDLLRDEQLMEQARLETPLLAKIFKRTGHSPRTGEEASKILQSILE